MLSHLFVRWQNNIIFTRYSSCQHGSLFKLNPLKKGSGQVPLKKHGPCSDIQKYGGYDKPLSVYFSLVRYTDSKGKEHLSMLPINLYQVKEFESDPIQFLEKEIGLINPVVLLPKVKYNSCIEIDGFRMHISGKQGASLSYKPAVQLVLGYQNEVYIRNISKYLKMHRDRPVNASDHISYEENLQLFDMLIHKMLETIFKVKFYEMGKKIKAKREAFVSLTAEDQCEVIMQMLNILHANVMTGNLTKIGLKEKSGKVTTSIDYSNIKGKVKLINQSVTGLFENVYVIK